jgi:hypothetical protein
VRGTAAAKNGHASCAHVSMEEHRRKIDIELRAVGDQLVDPWRNKTLGRRRIGHGCRGSRRFVGVSRW